MKSVNEVKRMQEIVQVKQDPELYETAVARLKQASQDRYRSGLGHPGRERIRNLLRDTGPVNRARQLQAAAWALGFGHRLGTYGIDGKSGFFTERTIEAIKREKGLKETAGALEEKIIGLARKAVEKTPLSPAEERFRQNVRDFTGLDFDPRDPEQREQLKGYLGELGRLRWVAETGDTALTQAASVRFEKMARSIGISSQVIEKVKADALRIALGERSFLTGDHLERWFRS
jgi:hypothetical protein